MQGNITITISAERKMENALLAIFYVWAKEKAYNNGAN